MKPFYIWLLLSSVGEKWELFTDKFLVKQEYDIALRLNPNDAVAHGVMGCFYYKSELFGEAIKAYKTAIKLNPKEPIFHFNLGSTYAELGRFDEAVEEYNTVLKLKPDDIDAKANLERIHTGALLKKE